MAKNIRMTAFLLVIALSFSRLLAQGYEIKVKISNYPNSKVILGHYVATASAIYPDDTIKLDAKGVGVFKNKKTLPGGVYILFLVDKKTYFDILLDKNQKFAIESDTTNFIKTLKFTGSPENSAFKQYQNFLNDKREYAENLVQQKKSASAIEKDSINKRLDRTTVEVKANIQKLIKENASNYFSVFLKSLQDIDVPDFPRDANGKITDSLFQARYYKAHYFDNYDYSDGRLLRTPLYEQKIMTYLDKVIVPMPDSINKEVSIILNKCKSDSNVFRYMLITLFTKYAKATGQIMGMDAVYVHIAENFYIPFATWSDKKTIEDIKKEVSHKKPNLIGNKAPDVNMMMLPTDHFMTAKQDTALKSNPHIGSSMKLSDIKSKYTVLIFWEAECGHCKKVLPVLHDSVFNLIKPKGATIVAFHIMSSVEGKRKWIDFVNNHNLYEITHVWSPYSLDFKEVYDVFSTPVIYILDENKKIIAKRIDYKQIESVIDFEEKRKK